MQGDKKETRTRHEGEGSLRSTVSSIGWRCPLVCPNKCSLLSFTFTFVLI